MVPFHTEQQAVNSLDYLPPPPTEQSPGFTNDKGAYLNGYALKGSPRWHQATGDANLSPANIAKIFSPILGVTISESTTPATWYMLRNMLIVTRYAPAAAKKYYMRTRPFVVYGHHSCESSSQEAGMRKDGSYPSGHTTFGTAFALMLAEAKPDKARELAKRGWEFGQSRVVCGAHWQSDVDAGRYVGAVEFAHLQSISQFRLVLEQVKQELNR
ncbi:phosphatase PAP2 family protein [Erwinia sp. J316]|uniref:acid phosphatase n=2 Tax=Erwinia sorbitola TaxID=2681984 RepID=A0A6I6EZX4_9GAMM|nr:phosphatase PAP2 family protein [Erwinia sorbitola]QGU89753.1 phosphatase PAP2 family protein [Erwinia sorbitola]